MVIGVFLRNEDRRLITQHQLVENQKLLSKSQLLGMVGHWELDLVKNRLVWLDQICRILGNEPSERESTYEGFLAFVHPEDRKGFDVTYRKSMEEGRGEFEIQHRVLQPRTGEVRIVFQKWEHYHDSNGRVIKSIGFIQDITDRVQAQEAIRASEKKYRSLFNSMNEGIALL